MSQIFCGNRHLNITVTGITQALCEKRNCDLILKTKRTLNVVVRRAAEEKWRFPRKANQLIIPV